MERHEYGKITDEGLEQLRARIGKTYRIEQPHVRFVNVDSSRHAAQAIGDSNPLWSDEEYGRTSVYGRGVAPPAILYAVAWGSWDMRRGEGLPGVHGLHSGDRWLYYRPLFHGDEVLATKALVEVKERHGSYAGRSVLQTREFIFTNQEGDRVADCLMSAIRTDRKKGSTRGKYSQIPRAHYSARELESIDNEIASELVRGSQDRLFEAIQVGDILQSVIRGPITVADMIAWVIGMGSPHIRVGQFWLSYRRRSPAVAVVNADTGIPETVERVHWDDNLAKGIGMPAAYDYGAQRGAYATQLLTNWMGDSGFLVELNVTYRGMLFLGDTLRIGGTVSHKWFDERSRTGFAEVQLEGASQRGDIVMPGNAIVALPSDRGGPLRFPIDADHVVASRGNLKK